MADAGVGVPRPDHVVVVVEENHAFDQVVGSSHAPYINELAAAGALFTDAHGVAHPSQPNYFALFSGSTHRVRDNQRHHLPGPSLGGNLLAAGLSVAGYMEGLPSVGFDGEEHGAYARKHNPLATFADVPASANRPFTDFPADYSQLPTVSFVVPDQRNDMHDGSVARGDEWLRTHLDPYVRWAKENNSLLIVTFDEDDKDSGQHVATLFAGPMVRPGSYSDPIDHYDVLRTIEEMYGLPYAGLNDPRGGGQAEAITDVWTPPAAGEIRFARRPQDVTAPAGAPVTFSVSAASSDPLQYQWLRDGVPLEGETGESLTLSAVAAADRGARFSVEVVNAAAGTSVRTREVTLALQSGRQPQIRGGGPAGTFRPGRTVRLFATGWDVNRRRLPESAFSWRVELVRGGAVESVVAESTGARRVGFRTLGATGLEGDAFYRVTLSLTDTLGVTQTATRELRPRLRARAAGVP